MLFLGGLRRCLTGPAVAVAVITTGLPASAAPAASLVLLAGVPGAVPTPDRLAVEYHGFLLSKCRFTPIDAPGPQASNTGLTDTNDQGQIVGSYETTSPKREE